MVGLTDDWNDVDGGTLCVSVFGALPVGVAVADRSRRILYANAALAGMVGKSEADLRGKPIAVICASDRIARERLEALEDGARTLDLTCQALPAGEDGRVLQVRIAPLDTAALPNALIAAVHDVTNQKRIEEALRESEQRFRSLARCSNDWFWETDEHDRFIFTFDEEGRIVVSDQVYGQQRADYLDPEQPPGDFAEIVKAVAERRPFRNLVYPQRRLDGQSRWVAVSGNPRYGADGRFLGFHGTATDITARREADEALLRAKQELEIRVRERTRKLESEILERRRAQDETVRANTAKTRFLAAASHDLRQPVQAAITYFGLLGRSIRQSEDRDLYAKLGQSLEAVQDMVEMLLDISRMDAGSVELRVQSFPVRRVIEPLLQQFAPMTEAKGLELSVLSSPEWIRSDPYHLERILRNLVDNAIKFTRHGSVRVACERRGDQLVLIVEDTGIGISPDQVSRIFEEYYQVKSDGVGAARSYGLGLSIVDRLARLLSHRLYVESTPGRGTRFEISTPIVIAERSRYPVPASARPEPADGAWPVPKCLVVVLDDDPAVLDSLCLALEDRGYDVIGAQTAEEALGRLQDAPTEPGCILADHRLGGGRTGAEAIAMLRREFGSGVPALLLTGDVTVTASRRPSTVSVPVLRKPIAPAALDEAIRMATEKPLAH